jgi:hypothetical protein
VHEEDGCELYALQAVPAGDPAKGQL